MIFREATIYDIAQIQKVRNSVKENMLSDPRLVTDADCEKFLFVRSKGWVCEVNNIIVGFAIADLQDEKIWALFVDPNFQGCGIGKKLHKLMLDWYFTQKSKVWLGTAPNTRAEEFYRRNGWIENGMHGKEIKFEMQKENWIKMNYQKLHNN
jgi:GNAT superfamily N-acetyltransferase